MLRTHNTTYDELEDESESDSEELLEEDSDEDEEELELEEDSDDDESELDSTTASSCFLILCNGGTTAVGLGIFLRCSRKSSLKHPCRS